MIELTGVKKTFGKLEVLNKKIISIKLIMLIVITIKIIYA